MRGLLALSVMVCLAAGQTGPAKSPVPPGKTAAAKTAPPADGFPIESIAIYGNSAYSREQILAVAGLRVGQSVTRADLEAARDRLAASGAFERIDFKYAPSSSKKGYAITFRVDEAGPFFPVVFEDLPIPDAQAGEALKRSDPLFGNRVPASQAKINKYAAVLTDAAAASGKPVKVAGRVTPLDSGVLAVVFRPDTPVARIARVRFTGNKVAPSSQLENAINVVAVGQPWKEARFRQLLETTIRPIYDARGRAGVLFPKIDVEKETNVDGLVLTVAVDEGDPYTLGGVNVVGAGDPAPILKAIKLNKGDAYNGAAVQEAAQRIEAMLRREGHMRATAAVDRRVDRASRSVFVSIKAEPGPQFRFGKLNIEGLDVTSEPVIRKLWSVKPGAPFNADYPDYFLSQVREQGYFDNLGETKSRVTLDEANRVADVTLIFKPAPPQRSQTQDRNR